MLLITVILIITLFPQWCIAETWSLKDYREKQKDITYKKEVQKKEEKKIKEGFDKYVEKLTEPGLMWGLGYQDSIALEMKGKFKFDYGAGKKVKNLWSNVLISNSIQLSFDYCWGEKSYLPSYYLFTGAGLGVDLTDNFKTYGLINLSAVYFFTRHIGAQIKYVHRLDQISETGFDRLGIILEYRF